MILKCIPLGLKTAQHTENKGFQKYEPKIVYWSDSSETK
jgi:hypothetical protein